jgi:diguanylate cyclase (GGDEF)-like protein
MISKPTSPIKRFYNEFTKTHAFDLPFAAKSTAAMNNSSALPSRSYMLTPAGLLRAGSIALIFFINSGLVIYAAEFSKGVASIWSANAILLFVMMISPKEHHLSYYAGAFAASVCANLFASYGTLAVLTFSLANMLEVALAMWLLSRTQDKSQDLISPRNLAFFGLTALTVPAISAAFAVAGSINNPHGEWVSWYFSDILGLLLVVPSLWVVRRFLQDRKAMRWSWPKAVESVAMFAIIVTTALLAFTQETVPLLFIIALPQIVAVFRGGAIGAVVSTAVVAIIATTATLLGHGTITMWSTDPVHHIWLLQGFLACQLLISLPIAAVLGDRDAKAAKIVEQERELRSLAEKARRAAEIMARKNAVMIARDELTGVNSRRRILQRLDHEMGVATKSSSPLSVALFDIDNFKQINDRYGHAVGDDVLRMIGRIANANVPHRFPVGRIGGEEFLILFPGLTAAEAGEHAERLRVAIMQGTEPGTITAATISIGIGSTRKGESIKTLLGSADVALYKAKTEGRNRLKLGPDDRMAVADKLSV